MLVHEPRPAGRHQERRLGMRPQGGAADLISGGGLAHDHRCVEVLAGEDDRARGRRLENPRARRRARARGRRPRPRPGCSRAPPPPRRRGSRSAAREPARTPRAARPARAEPSPARAPRPRTARRTGRGSAARGARAPARAGRRARAAPCAVSAERSPSSAGGRQRAEVEHQRPCDVAPRSRGGQPERAQHAARAGAEDPADAHLARHRRGVQRPSAAERHQREAARIHPALHRHQPQRAEHLGLGDRDDPLGARDRVHARAPRPGARRPARRRPGRGRARPPGESRRAACPAAGWRP